MRITLTYQSGTFTLHQRHANAFTLAFALAHTHRDTRDCSPVGSFIRSYPSFIQGLIHLNREIRVLGASTGFVDSQAGVHVRTLSRSEIHTWCVYASARPRLTIIVSRRVLPTFYRSSLLSQAIIRLSTHFLSNSQRYTPLRYSQILKGFSRGISAKSRYSVIERWQFKKRWQIFSTL